MKNRILLLFLLLFTIPHLLPAVSIRAVEALTWVEEIRLSVFEDNYPQIKELRIFSSDAVLKAIEKIPPKKFKPWPAQIRSAGFAQTTEGLVIGVNNGYPLLYKSETGEITQPGFSLVQEYLENSRDLTIGTVYSDGDTVGIHMYKDRLFNKNVESSSSSNTSPVVIEVTPGELYGFILDYPDYSFAEANPDWEPVELIRKNDESLIAWKYSDEKKSRFRYIIHDEDGGAVDEIDEKYFRDEYDLSPIESAAFPLRGFILAVREGSTGDFLEEAGDIYLRMSVSGAASPLAYFSSAPPSADWSNVPVQLNVCSDNSAWYILHEETVFVCDSNIIKYKLPALPNGFKYTDITVDNNRMLLSWEESRFPYIGRSGMMLIEMRDILN